MERRMVEYLGAAQVHFPISSPASAFIHCQQTLGVEFPGFAGCLWQAKLAWEQVVEHVNRRM